MFCTLSGQVPIEPVVSKKSGHIFEKRLILKALAANDGKCPETNEPLEETDLIAIISGGATTALPLGENNVPAMLKHIENEWDSMVLELNRVKKALHETRQELATVMYRYESAMSTISNFENGHDTPDNNQRKRSRIDDANDVNNTKNEETVVVNEEGKNSKTDEVVNSKVDENDDNVESKVLAEDVLKRINDRADELRNWRKNRTQSKELPKSDVISRFKEVNKTMIDEGYGISNIVTRNERNELLGSTSGRIYVFDSDKKETTNFVQAHDESEGGVSSISWNEQGNYLMSGGMDGVVKLWDEEKLETRMENKKEGAVVSTQWHPVGDGLAFICRTNRWEWRDMVRNIALSESIARNYSCGAIHPDGMLFSTGNNNGEIEMWDITSMKSVATFSDNNGKGKVSSICMSEKGYYMVSCQNNMVNIWDLRSRKVTGSFGMNSVTNDKLCATLDDSGEYGCAVNTDQVTLFMGKKKAKRITDISLNWKTENINSSDKLGCCWSNNANELYIGGHDGRLYQLKAND